MSKLKKIVLLTTLSLASTSIFANPIFLNPLNSDQDTMVKNEILTKLIGENIEIPKNVNIENIRQLNNSNDYMVKYKENDSYHTMMYLKDINALVLSSGDILDLSDKSFINKKFDAEFNKQYINAIDANDVIEYKAPNETNFVYVFTDPTCGYCKKLHRETSDYNDQGITIKYLPFPRGGLTGYGYEELVNTYCSADRKEGLYEAKVKNKIPTVKEGTTEADLQKCKDIVKKYHDLGVKLGINGTPAIFTKDGEQVGGYVPATQLKYVLDK